MTPLEPDRVLQYYSPEKDAEFAGMGPAERLAWLDEIRTLYVRAATLAGASAAAAKEDAAPTSGWDL